MQQADLGKYYQNYQDTVSACCIPVTGYLEITNDFQKHEEQEVLTGNLEICKLGLFRK